MPLWLFGFLAALAVICSLGVILQRNPIHSLIALVGALLVVAVLFIGLGAVTVGFLQAIVYAGAIMILFLFVIWLLDLQMNRGEGGRLAFKLLGALGAAALLGELLSFLLRSTPATAVALPPDYGSIDLLAASIFSNYLIAFEITSVLLLVGVVGAIALARRLSRDTAGASGSR